MGSCGRDAGKERKKTPGSLLRNVFGGTCPFHATILAHSRAGNAALALTFPNIQQRVGVFEIPRRNRSSRPGNFSGLRWFRHYPPSIWAGNLPWTAKQSSDSWQKYTLFQSPFPPVAQDLTSLIEEILECQIFGICGYWSCTIGPCGWLSLSPIFLVGRCLMCTWLCWDWPCPGNLSHLKQLFLPGGEFPV